ncbi:adenosylcobinamide-phosphate synthase CbiB [Qingshengfaniella alkalisoli]|uniref:Cobalamin biosynthesis protein CobD n=1 Tax=Qingshengfaniella alkalisoli TaxID=2599296 RepID=A0A5B8ITL6_9RHOB|nr:adenosylcobinamide-phosphate synthase CbiB [Qingshengfaniella alkalisoli]QDY69552.1 cobalamin biosynthesis protein CobD [Qingshengfaniella alkalisoli]
MNFAAAMAIALLIDWIFGWPEALQKRIGHPVEWIGKIIEDLDRHWNTPDRSREDRRRAGIYTTAITVGGTGVIALTLQMVLPDNGFGTIFLGILCAPLIAANSLHSHVHDVATPLLVEKIQQAREAVSRIVGRDPDQLDEAGIARASIETLAENLSDGVVAPLFWGTILGLPGMACYKAINTLDSMIGHKNKKYRSFGRFAAKLDDLANWIPARLTGLILCLTTSDPQTALRVMWRDARSHRSPNAGWPESAMAAARGVRLSGPRAYGDATSPEPWLNENAPDPSAPTIYASLHHYRRALFVTLGGLIVWAIL